MCARMVSMCSSHTACRLSRASVLWQACAKLGRRVVAYASADFQLDFLMWASCSTVPACTARGELGACPSNPRIRLCCRCLLGSMLPLPLRRSVRTRIESHGSSRADRDARIQLGGSDRAGPMGPVLGASGSHSSARVWRRYRVLGSDRIVRHCTGQYHTDRHCTHQHGSVSLGSDQIGRRPADAHVINRKALYLGGRLGRRS